MFVLVMPPILSSQGSRASNAPHESLCNRMGIDDTIKVDEMFLKTDWENGFVETPYSTVEKQTPETDWDVSFPLTVLTRSSNAGSAMR